MKKLLAILLVVIMAISFAACGGAKDADETTTESTQAQTTEAQNNTSSIDESNDADEKDVAMETEAEYVVFNASLDFQLEQDAWLGVVPTGTKYEKEADADEVDIAYVYCENLNADGATSHRFAFEKEYFYGIEDGKYDLVLCSSDNEEIGKVLLQIGMEKTGEKITLEY